MHPDLIREIEERTRKPKVVSCSGMPGRNVLLDKGEGPPEILEIPPACRLYEVSSITGLADTVSYLHQESQEGQSTCVFVGTHITVCMDERGGRRDLATMSLPVSTQFGRLRMMSGEVEMTQRELVWLLTSVFRDNMLTADFLPTIRSLKFTSNNEGTSKVQHGEESLGASIEEQVVSGKDGGTLPDMVEFEVPVFDTIDLDFEPTCRIRCAVRFNAQDKMIVVKPEPGQLEGAVAKAVSEISERLTSLVPEGVSVLGHTTYQLA